MGVRGLNGRRSGPTRAATRRAATWALATVGLLACGPADPEPDPQAWAFHLHATGCRPGQQRSAAGVAVAPEVVATVAHAVDDTRAVTLTDGSGQVRRARLVARDRDRDVALFRLDRPVVAPTLGDAAAGDVVSIVTAVGPGQVTRSVATVDDVVTATVDGAAPRLVLRLSEPVPAGASGSPVLDAEGRVVGLAFAADRDGTGGWAVAAAELEPLVADAGDERLPLDC